VSSRIDEDVDLVLLERATEQRKEERKKDVEARKSQRSRRLGGKFRDVT
jgi:hypothetical protein